MPIRRPSLDDLENIMRIARSVQVDRNSPKTSGLVEYKLTREEYKRRLNNNDLAFVAENKFVTGFSIAYYPEFLRRLRETDRRAASDELMLFVTASREHFVYYDQLCILPELFGRGVGIQLHDRTVEEARNRSMKVLYCAIAHAPWQNKYSIELSARRDWKFINEVTTRSGLTFGVYEKRL